MMKISLPRTDNGLFEFTGEKIACIISKAVDNRWHGISVYSDSEHKYILAVSYHTEKNNENNADFVEVFDKLFSLDATLKAYARKYMPVIHGKDEECVRKTLIPLETSFSAAWSKLSRELKPLIKAELAELENE